MYYSQRLINLQWVAVFERWLIQVLRRDISDQAWELVCMPPQHRDNSTNIHKYYYIPTSFSCRILAELANQPVGVNFRTDF